MIHYTMEVKMLQVYVRVCVQLSTSKLYGLPQSPIKVIDDRDIITADCDH